LDKDKTEIIDLNEKTDLLATNVRCPVCGDKYLHGVPYVHVSCRCGATFKTDFNQDIYTKKSRQIFGKLAFKNVIVIHAAERYESAITQIKEHYLRHKCYDVSEITQIEEEYKRCEKCGICFDCLTCKACLKPFNKDPNRRKQKCPHCGSIEFIKTYFKEAKVSDGNKSIKMCPHCGSTNIRMTRTRNKTKCHLCNSTSLTEQKKNVLYEITISKKKAYWD